MDSYSQTPEPTKDDQYQRIWWADGVTPDGKIIIKGYERSSNFTRDLDGLEIWQDKLGKDNPLKHFYWNTEPDWKLELLSEGAARLKDESKAAQQYIDAQNKAKNSRLGLWAAIPKPSPSEQIQQKDVEQSSGISLGAIIFGVISIILAVTGWYGGAALIQLIREWRRRHQVPLIFLGRPSTGKSWLWRRLVEPDVTLGELQSILRTETGLKKKMPRSKPLGRFEVVPIYIDTPGGRSGEQVNRLLEEKGLLKWLRRVLIPTKSIWLIMLATTPEKNVNRNSPDDQKIDQAYIEQQLGHLDLPVGMLASSRTPKPQMVITCIGKFDLFSEHSSTDSSSGQVRERLQNVFGRHTSRIELECENQHVPHRLVMCSARQGWGANEVWRHIENAVFQ
jgi:hypothetical protein